VHADVVGSGKSDSGDMRMLDEALTDYAAAAVEVIEISAWFSSIQ